MLLDHDSRAVIAAVAVIALAVVGAGQASALASSSPMTLPDGRVYEMVTPVENHDADTYIPRSLPPGYVENAGENETELPFQVALDGDSIAYVGASTIEGAMLRWEAKAGLS